MAKPCCGQTECGCAFAPGTNIEITGTGAVGDPITISAEFDIASIFRVVDSETVDLRLSGGSGPDDPLTLQAFSSVSVEDLADVVGTPSDGESLVFDAATQTFVFDTLPPSPAGAVNAGNGISGDGTIGTPLAVATSGTWGVGTLAGLGGDSTIGLPIYIDSAGKVRTMPYTAFLTWGNISGKPTTFTPSAHTHLSSEITDLATAGDAAKVQGHKVYSQAASTPTPVSPAPAALDLLFFPAGT